MHGNALSNFRIGKVAVVGGSLAGLTTALELVRVGLNVTVFERDDDVLPSLGPLYAGTMTATARLLRGLGLNLRPRKDALGVMAPAREAVDELEGSQEPARFCAEVQEVLLDLAWAGASCGDYLVERGYSEGFAKGWFAPRALAWSGTSPETLWDTPIEALVRYWKTHGRLDPEEAQPVRVVEGLGAIRGRLTTAIEAGRGRVLTGRHVRGVRRTPGGAQLQVRSRVEGDVTWSFDAVVLAVHPESALDVLHDACASERALLEGMPGRLARVVRHRDHRLMPRDRRAWRAEHTVMGQPSVTRWLNGAGEVRPGSDYEFESWDPFVEPAPDRVVADRIVSVRLATTDSESARQALSRRQGRRATWFVGAWLRAPFCPEDAVRTAQAAASEIMARRALDRPVELRLAA